MIKKTKRELALDFFQNFMEEGTSKDEADVWVSQKSLIKFYEEMWSSGNILSPNEFKNHLDNFNKKLNEEENNVK